MRRRSDHPEVLEFSHAPRNSRVYSIIRTSNSQNLPMQNLCTNKSTLRPRQYLGTLIYPAMPSRDLSLRLVGAQPCLSSSIRGFEGGGDASLVNQRSQRCARFDESVTMEYSLLPHWLHFGLDRVSS